MKKQIKQFRYYGDGNVKNQPAEISSLNLASGSIFFNQEQLTSITQLGVQTIPGTLLYINNAVEPIIVGSTGIYELNLENISEITALSFHQDSIKFINNTSNIAYLVVDAIYNVGE